MELKYKKLHKDALEPQYATKGSAAFDLASVEEFKLLPGDIVRVRTGLAFEIPEGYELEIRPRSGLSFNSKLRIANAPGTIDSDFRGEVEIIVDNIMGKFPNPYTIT